MRVPRATFLVSLAAAVITLVPPAAVPAGAAPRPALPQLPQARFTVAAGLLGVDPSPNVRVDATPGPQVSDPAAGIIETFAGGSADGATAPSSTFKEPYDAVVAPDGAVVVADTYDNRIRRIDPATGVVSTIVGTGDAGLAGDGGPATQASLNFPIAAAYGPDGSLYVADRWNDRVRKVDPNTATITTVAGNGPDDANGGVCYTGDGVPATSTALCGPSGMAVAPNGNLFIADTGNDRIRMVDASTGLITTVAGNGLAGITGRRAADEHVREPPLGHRPRLPWQPHLQHRG
ncbi:MAG TPA: hypothetical protein VEN82_03525 [Actinomycetota bacterium]|nr:hypothetical protein [Actinomycetota bacterium]